MRVPINQVSMEEHQVGKLFNSCKKRLEYKKQTKTKQKNWQEDY